MAHSTIYTCSYILTHSLNLFSETITCIGEGNGTPLQYSCLENPMNRGAWWAAVHGVAKSRTRLSDFTFTFHFHALEKEMATHSSVLGWRIPGTGEPGGLPSMGSHSSTRLKWLSSSSSITCISVRVRIVENTIRCTTLTVLKKLTVLCLFCRLMITFTLPLLFD